MGSGTEHTDPLATVWPDASFTPIEQALLRFLLHNTHRPVLASELLREVWGYSDAAQTRTVSTTVRRLRHKIEPDPSSPTVLLNVRGQGYQLRPPIQGTLDLLDMQRQIAQTLGVDINLSALVQSMRGTRGNVVADASPLFGRQRDRDALDALVQRGARLITLHGGAGVGKTSLARAYAVHAQKRFRGGTWFCDVSSAQSTGEMVELVVDVLGRYASSGSPVSPSERLTRLVTHRGPTAVVLDNLEQLEEAAPLVVQEWVARCPELVVLATSRERLRLASEHVLPIEPLTPEHAAEMLKHRVQAVRLDRTRPVDDALFHDIGALLQGIPLAIEMAAARARMVPLAELRGRLKTSLSVLSLDRRGAPDRQKTLTQAIAWSWTLLSDEEQSALIQLSVFRRGGTLSAVKAVVETAGDAELVIASLIDKSMLRRWLHEGQPRFGLFEAVRQFVVFRSDTNLNGARLRHADWAVRTITHTAQRYEDDPEAGPWLVRERVNALDAHAFLLQLGDSRALHLALDLWPLFNGRDIATFVQLVTHTRGVLHPTGDDAVCVHLALARAYRLLGQYSSANAELQSLSPSPTDSHYLSYLLTTAAVLGEQGHRQDCAQVAEQAIQHIRQHGPAADLAAALHLRAVFSGDDESVAQQLLRYAEIDALLAQAPQQRWMSKVYSLMGSLNAQSGDADGADAEMARARAIAERFSDPDAESAIHSDYAAILLFRPDFAAADDVYQALFDSWRRHGGSVFALVNGGFTALLNRRPDRALERLQAARDHAEQSDVVGAQRMMIYGYLTAAHAQLGHLEQAEACATVTLDAMPTANEPPKETDCTLMLGHLDLLRARLATPDRAQQHRDAAQARLDAVHGQDLRTDVQYVADLLSDELDRANAPADY